MYMCLYVCGCTPKLCVCMYTCMWYVCVLCMYCVCVYVYVCIHICMRVYVCAFVCMSVYVYVCMPATMCLCMYACACMCMSVCEYVCVHYYMFVHMYVYVYACVCAYVCVLATTMMPTRWELVQPSKPLPFTPALQAAQPRDSGRGSHLEGFHKQSEREYGQTGRIRIRDSH